VWNDPRVDSVAVNQLILESLLVCAWAVVLVVRNRPPGTWFMRAYWLVAAIAVLVAAYGIWQMLHADHAVPQLEFVLYLIALAGLLPLAAWWMREEESRAASAVLMVALLVLPVLVLRVQQVFAGTNG
jgi:hypothetical protein